MSLLKKKKAHNTKGEHDARLRLKANKHLHFIPFLPRLINPLCFHNRSAKTHSNLQNKKSTSCTKGFHLSLSHAKKNS